MEGILGELIPPPGPEAIAKQERIVFRRARVNEKLVKKRLEEAGAEEQSTASALSLVNSSAVVVTASDRTKVASGLSKEETEKNKKNKTSNDAQLDLQIEESKKQLDNLIKDGELLITNVKVAAEYREKLRHDTQYKDRKRRILDLKDDADYCQNVYQDISSKWLINAEKTLPLELFDQMKAQQEACDELLRKKDDTITSLRREIEENDYNYENNLEKYQKDIILLGDRIEDHIDDLRKSFLEEFELLEDYTCQNREFILEENQKEWLELLEEFESMEVMNLDARKTDALEKFQLLNEMYSNAKQGFRKTKQELENDLRILIQEVEQIKVICQMNLDKMDYNLHVLRRREDESRKLKQAMKRKLIKLQDLFSEKTSAYQDMIVDSTTKSRKLLKEIERLEQQCSTGSKKTLELVTIDYRKYMDMWIINEETAREQLQKLVESEKFIYETQLGIELPVTDIESLDNRPTEIQSFLRRTKYIPPNRKSSDIYEIFNDDFGSEPSMESLQAFKGRNVNGRRSEYKLMASNNNQENEEEREAEDDPKVLKFLVKHISKICDQTGFIIEEKLRRIVAPLQDLEQQLIRADSLFQALGVKDMSELQILSRYIMKYCKVMKTYAAKTTTAGTDESYEFISLDDMQGAGEEKPRKRGKSKAILHEDVAVEVVLSAVSPSAKGDQRNSDAKKTVDKLTEQIETELGIKFDENGDIIEKDEEEDEEEEHRPSFEEEDSLEYLNEEESSSSGSNTNSSSTSSSSTTSYDTTCGSTVASDPAYNEAIRQCREAKLLAKEREQNETTEGDALIVWSPVAMKEAKKKYQDQKGDDESEEMYNERKRRYKSQAGIFTVDADDNDETQLVVVPEDIHQHTHDHHDHDATHGHGHHDHDATHGHGHHDHDGTHGHGHHDHDGHGHHDHDGHGHHDHDGHGHHDHHHHHHGHKHHHHHGQGGRGIYAGNGSTDDDEDSGDDVDDENDNSPSEGSKLSSTVSPSSPSLATSAGESTEIVYIEPGDILSALSEFCNDFNSEIKLEIPTEEDIITKKLSMMQFPDHSDTSEYWNRFYTLTDPKSKELWESVQYCFERYADVLKKRNGLIEEIIQLYQQNYELSHLLKKHLQRGVRFSSKQDPAGGYYRSKLPYC